MTAGRTRSALGGALMLSMTDVGSARRGSPVELRQVRCPALRRLPPRRLRAARRPDGPHELVLAAPAQPSPAPRACAAAGSATAPDSPASWPTVRNGASDTSDADTPDTLRPPCPQAPSQRRSPSHSKCDTRSHRADGRIGRWSADRGRHAVDRAGRERVPEADPAGRTPSPPTRTLGSLQTDHCPYAPLRPEPAAPPFRTAAPDDPHAAGPEPPRGGSSTDRPPAQDREPPAHRHGRVKCLQGTTPRPRNRSASERPPHRAGVPQPAPLRRNGLFVPDSPVPVRAPRVPRERVGEHRRSRARPDRASGWARRGRVAVGSGGGQ